MNRAFGKRPLGVALDIGTTVIKGSLFDIASKKEIAGASVLNEQKAYGQDVITRLQLATSKGGLKVLNKRLISAVNELIVRLLRKAGTGAGRDIKKIIAAGNSTMYHLALMIPAASLATAPFLPAEKGLQKRDAAAIGIRAADGADFTFLPNIDGFVGSDMLSCIFATGIHLRKGAGFIMDMGTNGELAFVCRNKVYVASCASGPAFEGRHISCGMPAQDGAIVSAKLKKGRLVFRTVGNAAPLGISGSGLIDVVSLLLGSGHISRSGRVKDKQLVIYSGDAGKIYITQEDIRQVQLAKAAFRAGIEILRRHAAVEAPEIKKFYVTGSFGEGIDIANAVNIGLIPGDIAPDRIEFLEDGALLGLKKMFFRPQYEAELDSILKRCVHVELHKDPSFQDAFAQAISF